MAISFSEQAPLTCPSCGEEFSAEVWTLIDAAERPDLVELLREERLNVAACPRCGHSGPAGAPLLLHDQRARRVYFAAPADAAEHQVRELAQGLLYLLVGSLPEEARLPYLGDVQVEQELAGVRRAVLRRDRRAARGQEASQARAGEAVPVAAPPPAGQPAPELALPAAQETPSPILEAVRAFITADSAEEIEAVVARHPELLDPSADGVLADLAETAYAQGEPEVSRALGEARQYLRDLRGPVEPGAGDARRGPEPESADAAHERSPLAASYRQALGDTAYQALMRAQTPAELADVARDHPSLLEPWADEELGLRAEQALDEGNERLAHAVEERREALSDLRSLLTAEAALTAALQELVHAGDDEEALAQALSAHPVLLTDSAQEALFRLSAESRARGDDALAERAVEYRAMLRSVREGLEETL